jgi:hypothetical protein
VEIIWASEKCGGCAKKIKNFTRFSEEKFKKFKKNSQIAKNFVGGRLGVPEGRSQRTTTLHDERFVF